MVWRQMMGYIPVNLANIIVSFGSIFILTRLLDAAEFGRYALVLVTLQMAHTLIFTWMEAAMERYYVRAQEAGALSDHLYTIYRTAAAFTVSGLIIFLAGIWLAPLAPDMKTILAFALGSTALQTLVRLSMEAHKAHNRITRYSVTYSSQMMLSFTIGILLILFTPLREAGPFAGLVIGNLIVLICDLPFMLRQMKGGVYRPERVKQYLIYGLPICFSLILEYALSASDRFVIAAMLGEAEVGQYSAGYGLANRSIDVLFIWIGLAVTPMLVRSLETDGLEACLKNMKHYGATLLLVTMPAAVGLGLVSEPVSYLLGEPVRDVGAQLIPWIVGAGVVNGMISYYIQRAFMLGGKTHALPLAMVAPMILNVALNIILLPKFGLMGAVYATIISYAVGLGIALVVARRYFPLPIPWEAFLKCSLACIIMSGVVLFIKTPDQMNPFIEVAIKGTAGALTYGLIVFATNAAHCRDLARGLYGRLSKRSAAEVTNV